MQTHLFSPFKLRGIRFRNRVVASPMWQYAGVDGFPSPTNTVQLGRLAEGGAGLVFQEGTTVHRHGRGTVGDLGLWDDAHVPHHATLADLIRGAGAVPGIQLIHAGRKGRRSPPWSPPGSDPAETADWPVLAPSAVQIDLPGATVPRAMTREEIESTRQAWVTAARRAHEAGYEVLELQAAHGYLLHTFLSPLSNLRTDEYGGSRENRYRFLLEAVDGVRSVWPEEKPLFIRLSVVDVEWSVGDTVHLITELARHGVDVIDCTTGGLTGAPAPGVTGDAYGYQVPYAAAVRAQTGIRTMAVGHIVHADQAEAIVADGHADLVALGRELLHNPNWPLDAARKLGEPAPYTLAPQRIGHWLTKRELNFPDFAPSTGTSPFLNDR